MKMLAVGTPRRAFLLVPFTVAGLSALFYRRDRELPNPALDGFGPLVTIVLFTDSGQRLEVVQVKRLVRSDAEWRAVLSQDEYLATRRAGTERAYTGKYWNNHATGLYRCICCGSALFKSTEKFDSDTGWPSFWAPVAEQNTTQAKDHSLPEERVEVSCTKCGAHLGHVFPDGPPPTGLRYCINSVALRFV